MHYRKVVIAIDIGGTKCELILANAETHEVLRHVREKASNLPKELWTPDTQYGVGRSPEMIRYSFFKLVDGIETDDVILVGNTSKAINGLIKEKFDIDVNALYCSEPDGILYAVENEWKKNNEPIPEYKVVVVSGTGTTGLIYKGHEGICVIDALGPDCGDWGAAYDIGRRFIRNAMREQKYTDKILPETIAIYDKFKTFPDFKSESFPYDIVSYLMRNHDRTVVAAVSEVCDECARNGSKLAEYVLESAVVDLVDSLTRAIAYKKLDKEKDLPIIAAGSVLENSDFVFNNLKRVITRWLPNTRLVRSKYHQVEGQLIYAFESMRT